MASRRDEGASTARIMEEFGRSNSAVCKVLREREASRPHSAEEAPTEAAVNEAVTAWPDEEIEQKVYHQIRRKQKQHKSRNRPMALFAPTPGDHCYQINQQEKELWKEELCKNACAAAGNGRAGSSRPDAR